jgi:hypothetical protein
MLAAMSSSSEGDRVSDSRPCAGCGGRNEPGITVCGFCGRQLGSSAAVRAAGHDRHAPVLWVSLILLGLVVLGVLLFNLAAQHLVR